MAKTDTSPAIEQILRLRRAARQSDESVRDDLVEVREFLEDLIGPTIRPADAARILRVSEPALHRWLENGEIASVLTPRGRREIPLQELVELLEEVEHAREAGNGTARPLSRVIRDRQRRADAAIDIDRLLPRRSGRTHRSAELQALAYHRLVAERLSDELLDDARRRLRRWRDRGQIQPRWFGEWERVLDRPLPEIKKTISADTPRARALRQTSPFVGVLTEQERQRLVRAVHQRGPA
jgi:hypothetical protein